jgi:hypothetical protein
MIIVLGVAAKIHRQLDVGDSVILATQDAEIRRIAV